MRVCGKALPPRAALLLTFDFASLVLVMPLLFMVPVLGSSDPKPVPALLASLARLMAAGLLTQAICYYNELYNLQVVRRPSAVVVRVLRAFALLCVFMAVGVFVLPDRAPVLSRLLMFGCFLGVLTVITRMVALPRRRERVVLLSGDQDVPELEETIRACPEWNMEVVAVVRPSDLAQEVRRGTELQSHCDRVILADARAHSTSTLDWLLGMKMRGLRVENAQGFYERATGRVHVDWLRPDELICSYDFQNGVGKRRLKRIFDILVGSMMLLMALPAMSAVALLIWLQRDGAILFTQQRVGLNGELFRIYKFRTMRPAAPGDGARWAAQEGHRITRSGAFLRKYRLDELPQLLNIIKGDMSIVGPRPEQPLFCELLTENIPFYQQRHSVPPGLTGWAQVRYHYGSSIAESRRKLEYDLFYVKHLSLWLDIAVMMETVKVVTLGRGAR